MRWIWMMALCSMLCWPVGAEAYNVFECPHGGGAETWNNNQSDILQIDQSGFPSGSAQLNLFIEAINRWENIPGSNLNIRYNTNHANADGYVYWSDLTSEIAWISDESMVDIQGESDLGVAFGFADLSCNIVAFDILFNAEKNFDYSHPQPPTTSNLKSEYNGYSFLNTALHELGHMSLDHTTLYDIMTTDVREGGCLDHGNHPERTGPDSRKAMRDLYPASGSETDLAVTSCYVKNLGGADRKLSFFSKQTKQGLCPGNSFTVERTLINYGNNSQNFTLAYYLSDDLAITKNDILVQTKQTTLTAESTDSAEVSLTIPSIPSSKFGKWLYAGAIADPDQTLGENTTSNNRALLRSKIKMASLNDCMTLSAKSPKDGESQEQEKRFVAAYFDPTETVSRSTFVAIGMVTDIRYQQIMRAGPVYTWIHFRPEQILKEQNLQGRKGNTVVIRQYGGVDIERGYHYWMEGAPQLKTNQRYLAFLGKNQRHLNPYVGGQGGLWKIQTDPMRYDYEFVTSYFGDPIVGFKEGRFLLGSKRNEHPLTLIEVLSHLKKIIAAAPRQDLRYEVTKPIYFIKTVFPQTRG